MPELPEVEIMRRFFETAALAQKITAVEFLDDLDKVFKSSREELETTLVGQYFTETQRIGKYLFAKISNSRWLHLHFGMTGNLKLFQGDAYPRYTRFVIQFDDGRQLAFCDLRKFGVIQVISDPDTFCATQKIGTDLLHLPVEAFIRALKPRRVAIKTALLDQKHVAGIGNWIADEMLFRARIHPLSLAESLTEAQLGQLHEHGVAIAKEAIAADTHYGDFPDHFFANFRKEGAIHPDFPDSPAERLVVGGRGTFIIPQIQKK